MWFKHLAAYSILIPIVVGIIKFKPASFMEKSVLLFLIFGWLVDGSFLFTTQQQRENIIFFYSLAESLFFSWFIFKTAGSQVLIVVTRLLFFVFPALWIIQYFLNDHSGITLFEPLYLMAVSILSGFSILLMIEKFDKPYNKPGLWFLLGIFFYCFCTFFISSFIREEMANQIWFLHNIINIITYLIYTKAFLVIGKTERQ